jgi:hypothetical protein
MNAHTSVRKVVPLPARVTLNLSRLACGLRLFLAAMAFTPVAHAQIPATPASSRPLNVMLEVNNLALDPEKNKDVILRMNALLNALIAKEVGKNDGSFLPAAIRPKPQ